MADQYRGGRPPKYQPGDQFGAWTLIERLPAHGRRPTLWVVRCECGTVRALPSKEFAGKPPQSTSCGCRRAALNRGAQTQQGASLRARALAQSRMWAAKVEAEIDAGLRYPSGRLLPPHRR